MDLSPPIFDCPFCGGLHFRVEYHTRPSDDELRQLARDEPDIAGGVAAVMALETDPMRIRCATDGCKFWTSINQIEGELTRASPRPWCATAGERLPGCAYHFRAIPEQIFTSSRYVPRCSASCPPTGNTSEDRRKPWAVAAPAPHWARSRSQESLSRHR